MFLLLFIVIFSSDNYGIVFYKNSSVENSLYAFLSLYLYVFAINIQAFEDAKTKRFEKNDQLLYNSKFIYVIFIYVLFESSIIGLLNRNSINLFLENLLLFARNDRIFINILLIYFIYLFLANAIGLHISNVIMLLLGNIIFWGNFIKIRFQNSVLTLDDFQLFKEVIGIANAYISSKYIILFLGGIILLLTIGILFRKKLLCYIKLSSSVGIIFLIPVGIVGINTFVKETFIEEFVPISEKELNTDKVKASEYGLTVYYLSSILGQKTFSETKVPENYGPDLFENFAKYTMDETENPSEKPDVVLIMAESLCDISHNQEEVLFNIDPFENMKQLQVGNVISPSYGGRTVLSEYEALTGLSNYTLGSDVVVFSSYINENTKAIGGLASQFKKNGYVTTAMHPNIASYYNRDVVYKNLEFDTFLSEKDFKYTEEDLLGDKRLKDSAFFANIKEQMEAVEDPQFIFGVTLAGHSPYIAKYKDTVIRATSESVSDEALLEVQNYAQTVYELDIAVKDLYEYVMQRNKPTLVYIWGDHLPSLSMFVPKLDDILFSYSVPFIAFSNFKKIVVEEKYISPNQIATQLIKDSGISHSIYFDYIYSLRKDYPVLQKAWIGEIMDSEEIELYKDIQYDLLFGKRYLLGSE